MKQHKNSDNPSVFSEAIKVVEQFARNPIVMDTCNPEHQPVMQKYQAHGFDVRMAVSSKFDSSFSKVRELGIVIGSILSSALASSGRSNTTVQSLVWKDSVTQIPHLMLGYGTFDGSEPATFPLHEMKAVITALQQQLFGEKNKLGLTPGHWEFKAMSLDKSSEIEPVYQWTSSSPLENQLIEMAKMIIKLEGYKHKYDIDKNGNAQLTMPKKDFEEIQKCEQAQGFSP